MPSWLDILPLVKYVDTEYSGRFFELRWRTIPYEHFDLKRYDDEVEAYLPGEGDIKSLLIDEHNVRGEELKFLRDNDRRLLQLTSPHGSWLKLNYDPASLVSDIVDSRGGTVHYGCDRDGRLINVTYPSGETLYHEYYKMQHLVTFSAALDGKSAPRLLLRNEYDQVGRISRQTLPDGETYTYSYNPADSVRVRKATVHTPDGADSMPTLASPEARSCTYAAHLSSDYRSLIPQRHT